MRSGAPSDARSRVLSSTAGGRGPVGRQAPEVWLRNEQVRVRVPSRALLSSPFLPRCASLHEREAPAWELWRRGARCGSTGSTCPRRATGFALVRAVARDQTRVFMRVELLRSLRAIARSAPAYLQGSNSRFPGFVWGIRGRRTIPPSRRPMPGYGRGAAGGRSSPLHGSGAHRERVRAAAGERGTLTGSLRDHRERCADPPEATIPPTAKAGSRACAACPRPAASQDDRPPGPRVSCKRAVVDTDARIRRPDHAGFTRVQQRV